MDAILWIRESLVDDKHRALWALDCARRRGDRKAAAKAAANLKRAEDRLAAAGVVAGLRG